MKKISKADTPTTAVGPCILAATVAAAALAPRVLKDTTACPMYARAALLSVAVNNLGAALVHMLFPDGGIESVARVNLGLSSPARTIAIGIQNKEGHERLWLSIIYVIVVCSIPEHVFLFLILKLFQVVSDKLLPIFMTWLHDNGGGVFMSNAPGRFRHYLQLALILPPLIYAYITGDYFL